MATLREQLEKLLIENETIMDGQSSDALYQEWAELALAVSKTMNGFVTVMNAVEACRELQKAYFKAKRAGHQYDASKLLSDAQASEKELDKLIKQWGNQMFTSVQSAQTKLFE